MGRVKIASLMVMLSLLAAGCSDSLTGPRLSAEQFDVVFTLSEDEIGPDGFFTAELTVTSQHPDTVVLHGNGSCAELLVLEGGDPVPVVRHSANCPVPGQVEEFLLVPGESHSLFWTMLSQLSEDFGLGVAGDPLRPGTYTVQLRAKLVAGDQELDVTAEAPLIVDEPATVDDLEVSVAVTPAEVAQHQVFVIDMSLTNTLHRPVSLKSHAPVLYFPALFLDDERMWLLGTVIGWIRIGVHVMLPSGESVTRRDTVEASMSGGTSGFVRGDPAPIGTYRVTPDYNLFKLDGYEVQFPAVEAMFTVTEAED